ncbi:MAG: hypothetical protein ABSG67_18390 [Thermoguttaceae bacterium]
MFDGNLVRRMKGVAEDANIVVDANSSKILPKVRANSFVDRRFIASDSLPHLPATGFAPPANIVAQSGIGDVPPDQPGAIIGRQNPVGLAVAAGAIRWVTIDVTDCQCRFPHSVEVVPTDDVAEILRPQRHSPDVSASRIVGKLGVDAMPEPQHTIADTLAP